jgi:beta-glucanase (GH16 family)
MTTLFTVSDVTILRRAPRFLGSAMTGMLALGLLAVVPSVSAQQPSGWKLAWSDEFDGAVGSLPDPAKWRFQSGPGAAIGGNGEAELYCAAGSDVAPCKANTPNAYLDGRGHLVIAAVKTDQTVTVGAKKNVPVYTSARLNSVEKFQYGRIEASIRMPAAADGVWPAFWAMGAEDARTHWPATGEIDVMEQWNPTPGTDTLDPLVNHGSVHGPKAPGSAEGYLDQSGDYRFPAPPANGLHQFAMEWGPGEVDFYVDGYLYERQSVATLHGTDVWEEDRAPFLLLLNLAMGGGFFGYPNASTPATPAMVVDYVRVYQRAAGTLPAGWSNYDVGGPAEAGSSTFKDGIYSVAGSGAGIAGHFDQFQYAYKGMGGDGEVSAHVLDQTSKVAQAKAGVMLREARGAASMFAMMFVSPDGSVHFRYRAAEGEAPAEVVYQGQASWLKVGRLGNVFTGYVSADGKNWTAVGNARLAMPFDTTAGLVATSRDNRAPNAVRFDYVDVTKTDAGYDGTAVALPGVVQAEDFDMGGAGYSYSAELGEAGPAVKLIAAAAGTDSSASGYYLAGLPANRYVNYSVVVESEGDYVVSARVGSAAGGGAFHFNIDQKPVGRALQIPNTGGAERWKDVETSSFHLTPGHHTLALVTDAGPPGALLNLDFFNVRPR